MIETSVMTELKASEIHLSNSENFLRANNKESRITSLPSLFNSWRHQKTSSFLTFSGGIIRTNNVALLPSRR